MITFTLLATLVLAVVLAILIRPLRRSRGSISYARQAQNIHYARERLAELEQQLKNAAISATDYEALKLEIESTLASDIDLSQADENTSPAPAGERNTPVIWSLVLILPVLAGAMYYVLGTPGALTATTGQQIADHMEVEAMISAVEQRLQERPDDAQGWQILARTYYTLGRYQMAANAYLQLLNLTGENADTYAQIADASALAAGGIVTGDPARYVQRALELNPNQPQALWLAGLNAVQLGLPEQARGYWSRLLPMLADAPQQQAELRELIEQTVSIESDVATAETGNTAGVTLAINVALDETLRSEVSDNDVVFVIARAEQGPPAPLAVRRLTVQELPAEVSLSDADAMLPQLTLSRFEQVIISARVAKSGNPVAQAGDLQSDSVVTANQRSEPISLIINTKIK